MKNKAWIISIDMGYGHQRAAYPFREIAYDRIITANSDKILTKKEKSRWKRFQFIYEGLSRMKSRAFIGHILWKLYDRMQEIASPLANALHQIIISEGLNWGKDIALVISTDAVHYGDEDWGGKNYAPFGTDEKGTRDAVAHEHEIIQNCLSGELSLEKIKKFTQYTVQAEDFRQYKWTWCGRYSVPFGLSTAWYLEKSFSSLPLTGISMSYANSIDHSHLPVSDLGMGVTAPADSHHWVGYAAVGYVEKTTGH